jgi:transposase InsO family protein
LKKELRVKPLLTADQLSSEVQSEMGIVNSDIFAFDSLTLIDAILQQNHNHASLARERVLAEKRERDFSLKEDLLFYKDLLVVPDVDNLRTEIIREAHTPISSAHPSPRKTIKILRTRYFWRTMRKDVTQYIANCHECRRAHRPKGKTPGLLHSLPVPQYRWQHICVDFKSFPADKDGYNNIAVFIDRLGREAISIPCTNEVTARGLAELFYVHIYRHYNVPESIVSDRGRQFISAFWNAFCSLIGTKVKLSTAYHPETDNQTEIMNQYIDERLRPYVDHYQDNWASMLPAMDNAQLTLPHSSLGVSLYELGHGVVPRKSFDWKEPAEPRTARDELSVGEARDFVKSLEHA